MFIIDADKTIHLTRGDAVFLDVTAEESPEVEYIFQEGDVVQLEVFEKGKHDNIVLTKRVFPVSGTYSVEIYLSSDDTRIGDTINKPKDYWYNIELNPDTLKKTLIGYDIKGPKVFRLYPEGVDAQ